MQSVLADGQQETVEQFILTLRTKLILTNTQSIITLTNGVTKMTTTQIKINLNCYHEFSSMIDTCANIPEEDNEFDGLFTALDAAEGNRVYVVASLNEQQVKMFIHFIQKQIEYLDGTTIPELNYDGNYAEAGKCRYTIKALGKLMAQCEELLVA